MAELFASGRLVDLILVLVVFEAVLLMIYWRVARRGMSPAQLLPNLFAGTFLLLALRAALSGSGWLLSSGFLAAAGVAHLIDIAIRWRG